MLHPKKQLTCGVGGSVSVMGVVYWFCISSRIGDIAFFNAVSLRNNQPAWLLAFGTTSPQNLWHW